MNKKEVEAVILMLIKRFGNVEVRNELYKQCAIPPFVITKDNEVIFVK